MAPECQHTTQQQQRNHARAVIIALRVLLNLVLQLTLKYRATMTPKGKITAKATHMQMPCALAASTVSRLGGPESVLVLANGWEVELKSMVKGCRFVWWSR